MERLVRLAVLLICWCALVGDSALQPLVKLDMPISGPIEQGDLAGEDNFLPLGGEGST